MRAFLSTTSILALAAVLASCSGDSGSHPDATINDNSLKKSIDQNSEKAADQVNDITEQVKQSGEELLEAGKEKAQEAKEALQQNREKVEETVDEKIDDINDKLNELGHPQ